MTDTISGIGNAGTIPVEPIKTELVASSIGRNQTNEDTSNQRLIIEPVSSHRYIYKVMDSTTGEVIRQLPNEHVAKMISDPDYQTGGLVKASA